MTSFRFHLRQSISLQLLDSSWGPSQSLPPFSGGGFVQVRSLTCSPVPHHLLHWVHSPHSLHPPSPGELGSRKAVTEEKRVKRVQLNTFSFTWHFVCFDIHLKRLLFGIDVTTKSDRVCCWFSSFSRAVSPGFRFSSLHKTQHCQNPIRSWNTTQRATLSLCHSK